MCYKKVFSESWQSDNSNQSLFCFIFFFYFFFLKTNLNDKLRFLLDNTYLLSLYVGLGLSHLKRKWIIRGQINKHMRLIITSTKAVGGVTWKFRHLRPHLAQRLSQHLKDFHLHLDMLAAWHHIWDGNAPTNSLCGCVLAFSC